MNKDKALILLSGGLDSLVALGHTKKLADYDTDLAITFDYGQKSAEKEILSSKKICEHYNIQHKVIKLDWLKEITKTSLVADGKIPESDFGTRKSAGEVWVPNRNALFLNIAGSFCDALGYKYIIYGANKDEGETFPDNTEEFREKVTGLFKTSTLVHPRVIAPLINYHKDDIVRIAAEDSVPLEYVWSCYNTGDKHCGRCESCNHLKKALIANHCEKYIKLLFRDEN